MVEWPVSKVRFRDDVAGFDSRVKNPSWRSGSAPYNTVVQIIDHPGPNERWLSPYEPEDTRSKLVEGILPIRPLYRSGQGHARGTLVPRVVRR